MNRTMAMESGFGYAEARQKGVIHEVSKDVTMIGRGWFLLVGPGFDWLLW